MNNVHNIDNNDYMCMYIYIYIYIHMCVCMYVM